MTYPFGIESHDPSHRGVHGDRVPTGDNDVCPSRSPAEHALEAYYPVDDGEVGPYETVQIHHYIVDARVVIHLILSGEEAEEILQGTGYHSQAVSLHQGEGDEVPDPREFPR